MSELLLQLRSLTFGSMVLRLCLAMICGGVPMSLSRGGEMICAVITITSPIISERVTLEPAY